MNASSALFFQCFVASRKTAPVPHCSSTIAIWRLGFVGRVWLFRLRLSFVGRGFSRDNSPASPGFYSP